MEIRNLGRSGLGVSAIGLGCNNFGRRIDMSATPLVVHKALDLGITMFDTGRCKLEQSGSENALGELLGTNRKHIVLATTSGLPFDESGVPRAVKSCQLSKPVWSG